MNKTSKVYFLSALVIIAGCYLLNESYSMFVQTEEKQVVDSIVPILKSEISIEELTVKPNEEVIIKEKITNTGDVAFNYSLITDKVDNVKIIDFEDNNVKGLINENESKDIYLYVNNNTSEDVTVKFLLLNNYVTLYNDLESNIEDKKEVLLSTNMYSNNEESLLSNIYKNTIGYKDDLVKLDEYNVSDIFIKNDVVTLPAISNSDIPILDDINNVEPKLYKTYDNLGITYYYRGNVDNNYVFFNNKLWRIIRINGDDSIRIISEDIYKEEELKDWYESLNEINKKLLVETEYCNYINDDDFQDLKCGDSIKDIDYIGTINKKEAILTDLKEIEGKIVVSLNSKVLVTSGNGLKNNPYKIKLNIINE